MSLSETSCICCFAAGLAGVRAPKQQGRSANGPANSLAFRRSDDETRPSPCCAPSPPPASLTDAGDNEGGLIVQLEPPGCPSNFGRRPSRRPHINRLVFPCDLLMLIYYLEIYRSRVVPSKKGSFKESNNQDVRHSR